jgi:hypothetical protein
MNGTQESGVIGKEHTHTYIYIYIGWGTNKSEGKI